MQPLLFGQSRINWIARVFARVSDHEERRTIVLSLSLNTELRERAETLANSKSKYMGEIVAKSRFVSDVNESNVIEVRVAAPGVKRGLFPRATRVKVSNEPGSSKGPDNCKKKKKRKEKETRKKIGSKNADRRKNLAEKLR